MLDKIVYISNDKENEAGQKSDGTWYCKSLKFKNDVDLHDKIVKINKVLNDLNYNTKFKFRTDKEEKK